MQSVSPREVSFIHQFSSSSLYIHAATKLRFSEGRKKAYREKENLPWRERIDDLQAGKAGEIAVSSC